MPAHNLHPTETDTVFVVRPGHTITLDDGVTLGPGTELSGDEVDFTSDADMYVRPPAPGFPTASQVNSANLAVPVIAALPMNCASRALGAAPLSVTFDVIGVGTGVVQAHTPGGWSKPDWASIDYWWTFGDPAGGAVWEHSGRSKNNANGYIATHVFESAGTFTVTLRTVDWRGDIRDYEQQIVVTSQATAYLNKTYYVKPTGDNALSGLDDANAWQTVARAMTGSPNGLFSGPGPRRVLFKRDGVWNGTASVSASGLAGPFELGAYDAGADPVISFPTPPGVGVASFGMADTTTDVRVIDVKFEGADTHVEDGDGVHLGPHSLMLRGTITGFDQGVNIRGLARSNVTICEVDILESNRYAFYSTGGGTTPNPTHIALIGCTIDHLHSIGSLARVFINRSVVHHNKWLRGQSASLRIMSQRNLTDASVRTEFVLVSGNVFETDTAWMVECGPESNDQADRYLENVIFEGNLFKIPSGGANQKMIMAFRDYITIRNNVFDMTGRPGVGLEVLFVGKRNGYGDAPTRCRVVNNTCYRGDAGPLALLQDVQMPTGESLPVFNNAVCGGGAPSVGGGGSADLRGNYTNPEDDEDFVNPATDDFHLVGTSDANNGCVLAPARKDRDDVVRNNVTALRDRGAHEFVP